MMKDMYFKKTIYYTSQLHKFIFKINDLLVMNRSIFSIFKTQWICTKVIHIKFTVLIS